MLRLVELILAIRQSEPAWCWDELVDLGLQTGTLSSAYPALALADILAPGTVPEPVLLNSKREVPAMVVEVVADLSPATAHSIRRFSLRERYMWTSSLYGKLTKFFYDVFPVDRPFGLWAKGLRIRFWRIVRGRVSISSSTS
jgi:hypothetical protein